MCMCMSKYFFYFNSVLLNEINYNLNEILSGKTKNTTTLIKHYFVTLYLRFLDFSFFFFFCFFSSSAGERTIKKKQNRTQFIQHYSTCILIYCVSMRVNIFGHKRRAITKATISQFHSPQQFYQSNWIYLFIIHKII